MEITTKRISIEGSKRQHVPYVIKDKCPHCGKEVSNDYTEQYIDYPELGNGKSSTIIFVCDDCEDDWTQEVTLLIVLGNKKPLTEDE